MFRLQSCSQTIVVLTVVAVGVNDAMCSITCPCFGSAWFGRQEASFAVYYSSLGVVLMIY
jgi:hypothetical protein